MCYRYPLSQKTKQKKQLMYRSYLVRTGLFILQWYLNDFCISRTILELRDSFEIVKGGD